MQLRLTHEERATLEAILKFYLGELRMEVSKTDSGDFRERLKREEVIIKDLIPRLETLEADFEEHEEPWYTGHP